MADLAEFDNASDSMYGMYKLVNMRGVKVAPRGQETNEVEDMTIVIHDPTDVWANPPGRDAKFAIAAAETLQLIGGFSDPQRMTELAPNFHRFLNGGILLGSYGSRIQPILPQVVQKLEDDPDSRQAVAVIWDPLRDLMLRGNKDVPCTIAMSFRIRQGKLNMTTHMRSNDLFWGWTYDVFQFCQLLVSVSNVLGCGIGEYVHHADSFHFYERDRPRLERIEPTNGSRATDMKWDGIWADTPSEMQDRAYDLFYGEIPDDATEAEKEMSYACQLR